MVHPWQSASYEMWLHFDPDKLHIPFTKYTQLYSKYVTQDIKPESEQKVKIDKLGENADTQTMLNQII